MAEEIYEEVMKYRKQNKKKVNLIEKRMIKMNRNIKKPEITILNRKEEFKEKNKVNPIFYNLESAEKELNDNKCIKLEKRSDLKRTNRIIGSITDGDITHFSVANSTYIFFEDGEITLKTFKHSINSREFKTMFGTIICQNNGEWGGCLYVKKDDGDELVLHSYGYSFDYVHEYDGRVFVCDKSLHLGGSSSMHEIIKENDKLVLNTIFDDMDINFAGYHFEKNYLYFYSTNLVSGLYMFNLSDNTLECIKDNFDNLKSVNSLFKKGNQIYVYGEYNLIKYDLKTKAVETFTNLEYDDICDEMHANGMKLHDLWKKIIL